jgi:hypothetical protein
VQVGEDGAGKQQEAGREIARRHCYRPGVERPITDDVNNFIGDFGVLYSVRLAPSADVYSGANVSW